jgi:hypothetical protein
VKFQVDLQLYIGVEFSARYRDFLMPKHDILLLNATVFILLLMFYFTINVGTVRDVVEFQKDTPPVNNIPVLGPAFDYLGVDQELIDKVNRAPIVDDYLVPDRRITFDLTDQGLPGLLDMSTKIEQALEIACMLGAKAYVKSPKESLSEGHNGVPVRAAAWSDYLEYRMLTPYDVRCRQCEEATVYKTPGKTLIKTPQELLAHLDHNKSYIDLHSTIFREDLGMAITLLSARYPRCKSTRVFPGYAIDARTAFQMVNPDYLALKIRMGDDSLRNSDCSVPGQFKSYFEQIRIKNSTTLFIMGNIDQRYKRTFKELYMDRYKLVFEDEVTNPGDENYKRYMTAYAIAEGATQGLVQVQRKTKWDNDGKLPTCKAIYFSTRLPPGNTWWTFYSKASKVLNIS